MNRYDAVHTSAFNASSHLFSKNILRTVGETCNISPCDADMAQLVEHHLAKVGVAGSNPVVRSRIH